MASLLMVIFLLSLSIINLISPLILELEFRTLVKNKGKFHKNTSCLVSKQLHAVSQHSSVPGIDCPTTDTVDYSGPATEKSIVSHDQVCIGHLNCGAISIQAILIFQFQGSRVEYESCGDAHRLAIQSSI